MMDDGDSTDAPQEAAGTYVDSADPLHVTDQVHTKDNIEMCEIKKECNQGLLFASEKEVTSEGKDIYVTEQPSKSSLEKYVKSAAIFLGFFVMVYFSLILK